MPAVTRRIPANKMRRLFPLVLFVCSIVVILTLVSKWSNTSLPNEPNENFMQNKLPLAPIELQAPRQQPTDQEKPNRPANQMKIQRSELPKYIHLDLKGAPPKADNFYPSFFKFLDQLQIGVKGFVIEYEDMLPLEGRLINTTHRQAYTRKEIEIIQNAATAHQFEIIPLIQTFGHLEWILKLRGFELNRDDINLPMVITPCLDSTYALLDSLLQQTLNMHPNSKMIHIGCDEVILTNSHPQCQDSWKTIPQRYIDHVKRVVNIIRQYRPEIRILIWDDVIRSDAFLNNDNLLEQLRGLVEPVAWYYRPKFEESYVTSPAWHIYAKLFPNIWAASAFKGGLNRFSIQTNSTHHVLNNQAWRQFMESPSVEQNEFSGIILTGWSRFDHFMPLCDILPTAYESLIGSLHILNTGEFIINEYTNDCQGLLSALGKDTEMCLSLPGLPIWSTITSLMISLSQIEERLTFLHTVAPSYNRKHSFVRQFELDSRLTELQALQNNLLTLSQILNGHFSDLYHLDVIDEWSDLYLTPIFSRINTTLIEFQSARNQTTWLRRPLV